MPSRKWKVRYLRLVWKVHRLLGHRRLRKLEWWQPIRRSLLARPLWQPYRDNVASGISIGLFFSMMPIPGQTLAAAAIAVRARGNIPFAVGACFVSNPLTEPFVRVTQHKLGLWLRDTLDVPMPKLGVVNPRFGETVVHLDVSAFILGFLTSGILLALASYPLVHLFSALLPHHLPIQPPKLIARPNRRNGMESGKG